MSCGKKFINDPNDVVTESIEGLVETYPGLQYLDGFPEVKVVLRADVTKGNFDKVALISGGGSGHEPAHAGYVGPGMLTAAVCGDVFASPSVNAVLSAIRAVCGQKGCLLIVKNYTGDRLNFGLAAEQAKAEGYKVEMVIVGDDCGVQMHKAVPRRGLAGTLFVHKVAGAAAEAGLSLSEVTAEAKRVSQLIGTMGVALSIFTLPGQPPSDRLGHDKMEIGLGIHGEPGPAADLQPVDNVVSRILKCILSTDCIPVKRGSRVGLMVNGLGATPLMELMIAAGKAVAQLQLDYGVAVARVYTGCFMTSLDMAGMSITILKVDDTILPRLDAPTKAPAWPVGVSGPRPSTTIPVPMPAAPNKSGVVACRPSDVNEGGKVLEAAIHAAANAVINLKELLNEWDSKMGDGDCGTTMSRGATAVIEDLKTKYPLNDSAATINEIGCTVGRVMGGTSGVLYEIFFKAAHLSMKGCENANAKMWVDAMEAGVQAIQMYGGASEGFRTMLDALLPALRALRKGVDGGEDAVTAFVSAGEAAKAGAEATKGMRAQAGRSSYVVHDDMTVPDAGAMAVATWLVAAAEAVAQRRRRRR